jgi:vacuolar-type H+-ATPase catalytic subunit A/Vma1
MSEDLSVYNLINQLQPVDDVPDELNRYRQMTANARAAFAWAGPYMERLDELQPDIQIAMVDIMKQATEVRLQCGRLLLQKQATNFARKKIDAGYEELRKTIDFICLHLNPAAMDKLDAVL